MTDEGPMTRRLAEDLTLPVPERWKIEGYLDRLGWPWDAGLSALIDEAVAYEDDNRKEDLI
jgi:hypothetical protein